RHSIVHIWILPEGFFLHRHRKIYSLRRNIIISVVSAISIVLLIFIIDIMNLEAFIFVCMPFVFLATGVVLIVLSIHRHRMKLSYYVTLILGILALLFPLIICLILFFAFALGGPVPN
ncbi:MAG: hypothetical protein K2O34_01485, partial [Acetatifactor sp.]|nr:hypothetical protein [Acetatifactor sp.]